MKSTSASFTVVGFCLLGLSSLIAFAVSPSTFVNLSSDESILADATQAEFSFEYEELIQVGGIPFIEKKPDFGGEACVAMALQAMKQDADQDFVFDQAALDPLLGRGCFTAELLQAARKIGFDPGPVWFNFTPADLNSIWDSLKRELNDSTVSAFCLRENGNEQFVLVTGVNVKTETVYFQDPNREDGNNRQLDRKTFFARCELDNKQLVKLNLNLKSNVHASRSRKRTDADYAQHVMKLKKKLPDDNFTIILQKPFVVIGDESEKTVKLRSQQTVKWAVDHLKQDYFSADPLHIVDVWLFKDKDSYEKNCQSIFNMTPGTPYGFYSSTHRSLVMNISTGGGTLVHEIVHPFIESNFALCPSWFNEGLASLYEQSGTRDGKIIGNTNWRLRGLQLTIRDERLGSFEELCKTTRREFYDDSKGTHYAQARYLCYYLQEKGLLRSFYREFRKNVDSDPSGYQTLQAVLERTDMPEFQKEWEAYVMKLRFGN